MVENTQAYKSLDAMKNIDIRTVDRNSLVDIKTITIDENLPKEEKIAEFIRQIKNPYCYKVGKIVVQVGFCDNDVSFEDSFENIFLSM